MIPESLSLLGTHKQGWYSSECLVSMCTVGNLTYFRQERKLACCSSAVVNIFFLIWGFSHCVRFSHLFAIRNTVKRIVQYKYHTFRICFFIFCHLGFFFPFDCLTPFRNTFKIGISDWSCVCKSTSWRLVWIGSVCHPVWNRADACQPLYEDVWL